MQFIRRAVGNTTGIYLVGGREVAVQKKIGEGGNADIMLVKATKGKEKYALKRMSVNRHDKEKLLIAAWEYNISQALPKHPNIIRCEGAAHNTAPNGDSEYLLLLQYAPDGTLLDYINKPKPRPQKDLLVIFAQVCAAVAVFHAHTPPISHRDLKPENVLRTEKDEWLLCDFGSSTTDTYQAKTSADRVTVAALLDKNTTPSYRSPEMCDLYRSQLINQQADVWALGVVLYQLLFRAQPFPDGTLAINSGKYPIPETHSWTKEVMDLLARMLCVDPAKRATIVEVQVAVGEIIQQQPRMADPWSLPFTSASLAAQSAAVSVARSKSPNQLNINGKESREPSTSRNSQKSADGDEGQPAAAAEGKKEKKVKKKKPPVPTFNGDDFDASFPEGAGGAAEGTPAKGAFISSELMQAKGIQWEENGQAQEGGEKKEGEEEEAKGEEGEEDVQEASGNGADAPRRPSFSGNSAPAPMSPNSGDESASPNPAGSLSVPAPKRTILGLTPPPPTSGATKLGRKERSALSSPTSAAASASSTPSGTLSPASRDEPVEGGEEGKKKKKKKAEGVEGEPAKPKKEKKLSKQAKAEAEVAASVAAAAAATSLASPTAANSLLTASPPPSSPTAGDFGESSGWGGGEDEDEDDEAELQVGGKKKAGKPSAPAKRAGGSFLSSKFGSLKGALSSKVSNVLSVGGGDESKRERSKSKSMLADDDELEDEEPDVASPTASKPVKPSRSFNALSQQASAESTAAPAVVPQISVTSPAGLSASPAPAKRKRKDKKAAGDSESSPPSPKPLTPKPVDSAPPSPKPLTKDDFGASTSDFGSAVSASEPSSATAAADAGGFGAAAGDVDVEDPFGDRAHFAAAEMDSATAALRTSFSSAPNWPPTAASPLSAPLSPSFALAPPTEQPRRRRGSNASTGSASGTDTGTGSAANTPSFGAQQPADDSFSAGAGTFDSFSAPLPAVEQKAAADDEEEDEQTRPAEQWGSEPAGYGGQQPSLPNITIDTSAASTRPTASLPPMPKLDPREADYLQFRYTSAASEHDEFLLQPPRQWLLADTSLPLASLDDVVTKATKKDNGAPRYKYTRLLILSSWAHRVDAEGGSNSGAEDETTSAQGWLGLPELFTALNARPVLKSSQVAFKSLLLLHRLMQYSSPGVLGQMFVNRQFVLSLQQAWTDSELLTTPPSAASPIHDLLLPYSKYVMRRIYFVYQYRQFEGNFSLGYYLHRLYKHAGWPHAWTLPATVTRDQVLALMQTMHDALLVAALVFEGGGQAVGEEGLLLRQAILVPLMDDLYAMWLSATFLMNQLCLYCGVTCLLPGQSMADVQSSVSSGLSASSLSVNGASLTSPRTPHTPAGIHKPMLDAGSPSGAGAEEDTIAQSLPAVIAHHRAITDRLHLFFSTCAPLPSVAALRRKPNLPGRVNPFQPTPPLHFPPPSNLPQVGLTNAELCWRLQAQCQLVGASKKRFIAVDDDLSRYQLMIVQQQKQQAGKQADESDDEDSAEESEDEGDLVPPPVVQSPDDPNSPFFAARQQQRQQEREQQQQQQKQQMSRTAPIIPQIAELAQPPAARQDSGNPFGDDELEQAPAPPPKPAQPPPQAKAPLSIQRPGQPDLSRRSTLQNNLLDFFGAPASPQPQSQPQPPPMPQQPPSLPQQAPALPTRSPNSSLASPQPLQFLGQPASPVAPPSPSGPFSDELDPTDLSYTELIGEGAASEVWSGVFQAHTDVAIRRFRPEIYSTPEQQLQFRRELEVLRKLRHPNVVLFMGACTQSDYPLSIVTELLDTSLYAVLHTAQQPLVWAQCLQIALDAAKGLVYLHSAKPVPVVHGDVKSINILLDSHRRAKLTDFLVAQSKQRDEERGWQWTAPEVLSGLPASAQSDVYSFGVVLAELVTRQVPYAELGRSADEVERAVVGRGYRPPLPPNCPADLVQLITACWQQKPASRPAAAQVVEKLNALLAQAKQR